MSKPQVCIVVDHEDRLIKVTQTPDVHISQILLGESSISTTTEVIAHAGGLIDYQLYSARAERAKQRFIDSITTAQIISNEMVRFVKTNGKSIPKNDLKMLFFTRCHKYSFEECYAIALSTNEIKETTTDSQVFVQTV